MMNEFNTKLIELLKIICEYIPANKPDERVIELFKELKEMNEHDSNIYQKLKEQYEQEIWEDNSTPIEDLDFSVRTCNCLKRYGVNTLNQLKDMSFNELNKVRNLGDKGKREILTFFMQEVFNK